LSDIAWWLSKLGLEKYESAFAEAEIEFADLQHLTGADLKEVGLPVGPRRRVQAAIEQLDDNPEPPPHKSAATPPVAPDSKVASAGFSDAERRHLTVVFVDLVGSTEMATRIDAEDMRHVITSYQNTVADVVARYRGFIARYMGDGVLCYFGWPYANEDDAEQAVRAGLDIVTSVKKTSGPDAVPLASRVGIATGVVIVGDLIGTGAAQEAAAVGETPNLAARLQGLAKPDQLVISQETKNLLGTLFELESIGTQRLKGIAKPLEVYGVVGTTTGESRFEARRSGTLSPIVGRERELDLMRECWARAKAGTGQLTLVSGEAGIGKSRITRALIDEAAQDIYLRLTYQCSPHHPDSAFYPVIQQLTYAAGINAADANNDRLTKLENLAGIGPHNVGLLATLLGIDSSERYAPLDLTPAQLRAHTMQALVELLVRQSQEQPLLAVFEDLHWVDPTTLELLDTTLDAISDQKVLIVATARPTFEHGFGGHPVVARFALNRLAKEQIHSIVSKLTDGRSLPQDVVNLIASRTDGVPLFVEELTKTVLESGVLKVVGNRFVLNGPLDALAIPSTLHDSLMARLDRLQPIKEVAQTAACIGREFGHQLLARISPHSAAELETALEGLVKAELIYRRGLPPEATYLFKHALVRDAAYESLLKERRRNIHTQILAALEKEQDVAPELLANHAETAGLTDRAVDLWETASKSAIARPAYDEGISHLERAVALITPRVQTGERAVLERALSLQVQVGVASLARRGYQADATKSAFEYALTLADRIGDTPMRYPVLYGLWVGMYVRAEHAQALRHAEALVRLAGDATETAPLVVAHRLAGMSLCLQGRLAEAQTHLDRALALYDPLNHKGFETRFGQDIGMSVHTSLALNLMLLGEFQRAEKHAQEAERAALASGHANTICFAHFLLALLASRRRDDAEIERNIAVVSAIASEHDLVLWLGYAEPFNELLAAGKGDETSIERYMQADATLVAGKTRLYVPQLRIEAGWRALAMGLREQAFRLASMAQAMIDETGETVALSDLYRLKGALSLDAGDLEQSEACMTESIAVAREQGGRMWELRAAIDLASLWHVNGRTNEAAALLSCIVQKIPDGNYAKDRATAQSMLAEFAA
jgi:predicted ATPase/class 3 adenylate cyclase